MHKLFFALATACACAAVPAQGADREAKPKGTICYSNNITLEKDQTVISCRNLGRYSSVADLYDKGYRVVNSGFMPDSRNGGSLQSMYFIVEEVR